MAKTIPSVKRAFKILELFLDGAQSVSVPEITARLDFPRTTAHDLVQTLVACGYMEKFENQSHRFALGLRAFELGSIYLAHVNIAEDGLRVAKKVSKACDETVQMAIRNGTDAVFIIRVDSSQILRLVSEVGSRLPAHCTAVGKMLLSALSDEELVTLYKGHKRLTGMTKNSITSIKDLLSEEGEIRNRGYAYDDCESNEAARCVAAPVYDRNRRICAAMSITVPVTRMNATRKVELVTIVQRGAEELSNRLGYRMNSIERRSSED
jgi:IclR family transcriptional regulator, KDG regulon repressor